MTKDEFCNKCETVLEGKYCSNCGWDNRLPEMGGYDPELDDG